VALPYRRWEWKYDMTTRSPRSIARSDIVAIACLGFMVGLDFIQALTSYLKNDWLAWIYSLLIPVLVAVIVKVARRTLRKIPD
jgi:hypothetical protein